MADEKIKIAEIASDLNVKAKDIIKVLAERKIEKTTNGTVDADENWTDEARRYYINIVGKYGKQVQALLKKASALEIDTICPLHGPVLTDTIGEVLRLYDLWSSYTPEKKGVLIACASIHGNTLKAANELKEMLR